MNTKTKMQPLPKPPPYTYKHTPSSHSQTKPSPYQIIPYKTVPELELRSRRDQPILRQPKKTNPVIWFLAIICLLFSLLLIFLGVATIVVFVSIKPKIPSFDTPAASLSVIYFDSPEFLNGDLTFIANFTNSNRKLKVRYEHLRFELYFSEGLIATRVVQPFSLGQGEVKLAPVHLISSLVYLPPNLALQLQRQRETNRVVYGVKGRFRVKAEMGVVRYSYWVRVDCRMEMTGPPNGVMVTHSCRSKR